MFSHNNTKMIILTRNWASLIHLPSSCPISVGHIFLLLCFILFCAHLAVLMELFTQKFCVHFLPLSRVVWIVYSLTKLINMSVKSKLYFVKKPTDTYFGFLKRSHYQVVQECIQYYSRLKPQCIVIKLKLFKTAISDLKNFLALSSLMMTWLKSRNT